MSSPQKRIKTLYNLLIFLFLLFMFGCAVASPIQNIRQTVSTDAIREAGNLIFMTYNIRAGGGRKNPKTSPLHVKATKDNLLKIAKAIRSVDPDIIGLQEVRGYNQAKFIAEKLNLNFVYITHGQGSSSRRWGLALLSKFPISKAQTTSLSQGSYRRILICTIAIGGENVSVINVHISLSHLGYDDTTYEAQFRAIGKTIKSTESPIVLMGDFNQAILSPHLSQIREKFVDTCSVVDTKGAEEAIMWGTWWRGMGNRIDFILIEPKDFEVIDVGLIPAEYRDASDHIAYWAKVKFKD